MAKNSYFQFKQFTIHQDKCAMKVCTDACVLGASSELGNSKRILDIGAGTGLLSLMTAQRYPFAHIHAVELDSDAYLQAVDNVAASPFSGQISLFNTAIQEFVPAYQYDSIISNPPFFQSDLLSPDTQKNQAHHSTSLTFNDLLAAIDRLLTDQGQFHILLPKDESELFYQKAKTLGWFMTNNLTLQHNKDKKPFRRIMTFGRSYLSENEIDNTVLNIYGENNKVYDPEFVSLMKDFYMIF
ncbi:tRNA1(Val) (adenine(37)-N6)-methyltransferase [Dyadobacter sp. CY312]|uniref:tRNA1(Val) (adenine(37)-N6)-methyltransferase n=1 Tax=Dyadobacter sp. CY312 TaxID=2907303 RepID=UPI001F23B5C5|nr:methyltransferase [Dyadobacter sp. CY312]MCE7039733.1 methyltransferase [Dyadobacter sp. CY312]